MTEPNSTNPQTPTPTPTNKIISVLESLLFVAEKPVSLKEFEEILPEFSRIEIQSALEEIQKRNASEYSGLDLAEIDNGYQLRTKRDNAEWVIRFTKAKPQRLSRAALETLSIIAYRQPVTRPEIDEIRGVDSGGVLKVLMEKNFVKILGKKDEPGHPLLYGTTKQFMYFFNLKNLSELPPLQEYTELAQESLEKLQKLFPEGLDIEKQLQSEAILPIEEQPEVITENA